MLLTQGLLYADDTTIFSVVNDIDVSEHELNSDLRKISIWAYHGKMSFNPDILKQAQEVIFSKKLKKYFTQMSYLIIFLYSVAQFKSIQVFTQMKNLTLILILQKKQVKLASELALSKNYVKVFQEMPYLPFINHFLDPTQIMMTLYITNLVRNHLFVNLNKSNIMLHQQSLELQNILHVAKFIKN